MASREFCDDENILAACSRTFNLPVSGDRRTTVSNLGFTERRVLQEIRQAGRIHRLEIATRCDLQPSTLTRAAGVLLELGLIHEETDSNPGRPGKPRQYLSVAPEGAYAVGVALTAEEMMVCVTDFDGRVVQDRTARLSLLDPNTVADQAQAIVQACLDEAQVDPQRIVGVGVTMPGNTSVHAPYFKPLPQFVGWDRLSPAELFSERLAFPVWVQNDAHATAVAEAQFGAAIRQQTFMTLYIAHGFGAGLYCNGRMFTGAHGNAGSIGGAIPRPLARPSGDDLLRTLANAGHPFARLQDVEWNAAVWLVAEGWISRAADQLAEVIRMIMLILDPQSVILTGLLPEPVFERLAERIRSAEFVGGQDLPRPDIVVSPLIDSGLKLGAAALPFMHAFGPQPPSAAQPR